MQHKFLTLAAAVAAAWVFGLPALAAGGAGVYGTVQGQDAVLYLRSGSADAAYTCMVGNTPVTPAQATPLSGLDTPAHTVILLDNSAAIPESQRDTIHDILNGLAGTRLNGETFTLDTLGAEVTPLCDGETDYLQLKTVVDSLTYNDHTAQLTDCVYRVLDSLVQQNSPALTRVVLITTGAEEEQYGYTRQELADLIRKAGFPLYIIGADDGTDAARAQLQELFALARLTDGDTYALSETQDVAAIVNGIRAWDRGVRVDVLLPAALCDGSDRAMQLSDGGANTVTLTLTMPFAAADNTTSDVGGMLPSRRQDTADTAPDCRARSPWSSPPPQMKTNPVSCLLPWAARVCWPPWPPRLWHCAAKSPLPPRRCRCSRRVGRTRHHDGRGDYVWRHRGNFWRERRPADRDLDRPGRPGPYCHLPAGRHGLPRARPGAVPHRAGL